MVAMLAGLLILAVSLQNTHTSSAKEERPHIVVIIADDLGWNDVSFHGSDQIPTPNIDALAYNGIILNSHYVPALCTPSRAALLTGKYPTTLGMQHLVILSQEPWGLPLKEKLLPEYLRENGYSTHAIGKWHLGFHKKTYTPMYRGFDTFYGYYNGYQDYYDHTVEANDEHGVPQKGYDMRRGLEVDYDSIGKYTTDLFTEEAVKIIHEHDNSQGPMFLYLAHLAPHSGNPDKPFQAPDEDIARFSHISDPERRVYAAMVHRMDQGVGKVVTSLRASGKLENSIILFMSDNGAASFGMHGNHGSNYPLRGQKESPWEGGVRGAAALWSPLLNQTRRVTNQMMHSSDWLPTLLSAAGLDSNIVGDIDGIDMWKELSADLPSPRREVFNNYDEVEDYSSLRVSDWKYITGTAQDGIVDGWYGDTGKEDNPPAYDISSVFKSEVNVALGGLLTEKQLQNYPEYGNLPGLLTSEEIKHLRQSSEVKCSEIRKSPLALLDLAWSWSNITFNSSIENTKLVLDVISKLEEITNNGTSIKPGQISSMEDLYCNPRNAPCLFHLDLDPCEELNLASVFPDVVRKLENRLLELKTTVHPPLNLPGDPMADPVLHNGIWTHWCDPPNQQISYYSIVSFMYDPIIQLLSMEYVGFTILTASLSSAGAILEQTIRSLAQNVLIGSSIFIVFVISKILRNIQRTKRKIVR